MQTFGKSLPTYPCTIGRQEWSAPPSGSSTVYLYLTALTQSSPSTLEASPPFVPHPITSFQSTHYHQSRASQDRLRQGKVEKGWQGKAQVHSWPCKRAALPLLLGEISKFFSLQRWTPHGGPPSSILCCHSASVESCSGNRI